MMGCVLGSAARAQDSTLLSVGVDGRDRSYYTFLLARHHLAGNFADDGFLIRGLGLLGEYEYNSNAVAGGEVDGDVAAFDAMVGYQKGVGGLFLRGYVGVDYEDHDLSPDNVIDTNRGSDFGLKVLGELESDYVSPHYVGLIGSYGTAKERYWLRLRGGYNFEGYIVGPEGLLTGNEESDERRLGAFLTVTRLGPIGVSVSAGYSDTDDNRGGGSLYGTLEAGITF
jgi:hypothetical protein